MSQRGQRMSFKTPRYRGKAKVDLQNQFIGAASNVKRWLRLLASADFPPLQLGYKSNRIHDNCGNITATRFLCTDRNPHRNAIRPQRLFTVEHHIILHAVGKVTAEKLDEVLKRVREFFN